MGDSIIGGILSLTNAFGIALTLILLILIIIIQLFGISLMGDVISIPRPIYNSTIIMVDVHGNPCTCPVAYQPVCGANGRTYFSSCFAQCDGITVTRTGACEQGVVISNCGPAGNPRVYVLPGAGQQNNLTGYWYNGCYVVTVCEGGSREDVCGPGQEPGCIQSGAVCGVPGTNSNVSGTCCDNMACVPRQTGSSEGTCIPPGGCTAPGGLCTMQDCCYGMVCNMPAGSQTGTCGPREGGQPGGECAAVNGVCSTDQDCCDDMVCKIPMDSQVGNCAVRYGWQPSCAQQGETCVEVRDTGTGEIINHARTCCGNVTCDQSTGVCGGIPGEELRYYCKDYDFGLSNLTIASNATVFNQYGPTNNFAVDECLNTTHVYEVSCVDERTTAKMPTPCPQGMMCLSGACTPRQCGGTDVACTDNNDCCEGFMCIMISQTENVCKEKPSQCLETDNGRDAEHRGSTTGNTYIGSPVVARDDYCYTNGTLAEYFCDPTNGLINLDDIVCPYGCSNGACNPAPAQPQCTDSDQGIVYDVKGTTTGMMYVGSASQPYVDACKLDSYGYPSSTLQEYYCDTGTDLVVMGEYACPYGCNDGKCNAAPSCSDTDGGRIYTTKGTLTYTSGGYTDQHTDYCPQGNQTFRLVEYWCLPDNGGWNSEDITCPNGQYCNNGKCG